MHFLEFNHHLELIVNRYYSLTLAIAEQRSLSLKVSMQGNIWSFINKTQRPEAALLWDTIALLFDIIDFVVCVYWTYAPSSGYRLLLRGLSVILFLNAYFYLEYCNKGIF